MEFGTWPCHLMPDITLVFGDKMPETEKPVRAQSTVRVRATRNMDLMNENEVKEIDRDEQVDRLIQAGYLVEVGEDVALTAPQAAYDTPNPTTVNTDAAQQEQAPEEPTSGRRARR